MLALVYGPWDSSASANGAVALLAAIGLAILHFAIGWVIARWWVVVLPVLVVALAVPAGTPDGVGGEPFPIWFVLAYLVAPVGVTLAVVGVLVRRWSGRPAAQG
ncbi:MAG TPA: hypothetical protein VGQ84_13520 [Gaiellaceae bacterium]|jgi:hypothetical protein|nr:hypothetical protein [Gaiellaceae bacterium]